MNKTELIEAIALHADLTRVETKKFMDSLLCVVRQTLHSGEKLSITGIGTFCITQQSARMGRNPRTGAAVKIAPKKVVKFRSVIEVV